jgi:hypothetical protein
MPQATALAFLVFKFIRMSSFMFSVMGLYSVSQLFLRGVIRCWGTGILRNSMRFPFCSYADSGANWGLGTGPAPASASSTPASTAMGATSCSGISCRCLVTFGMLQYFPLAASVALQGATAGLWRAGAQ